MTPLLRRTKIVITLGPALDDPEVMKRVMQAGAVVFRSNFSHGSIETHEKRIQLVRDTATQLNKIVALLVDLQGPKIRIGRFKQGKIQLKEDQPFILDTTLEGDVGDEKTV